MENKEYKIHVWLLASSYAMHNVQISHFVSDAAAEKVVINVGNYQCEKQKKKNKFHPRTLIEKPFAKICAVLAKHDWRLNMQTTKMKMNAKNNRKI